MALLSIAFTLFLLMDPLGNVPLFISFLKQVPVKRQRQIIFREMLIALGIIILFYFVGDGLMHFLKVEGDTVQIAGGIILFLICLKMIFPPNHDSNGDMPHDAEPFIVPLAVPLVAGPSVLAAVMIYSRQEENVWVMVGAILIAWALSLIILGGSSVLKNLLGWRGIVACERLMGLVLALIAVQMFLSGLGSFIDRHNYNAEGRSQNAEVSADFCLPTCPNAPPL